MLTSDSIYKLYNSLSLDSLYDDPLYTLTESDNLTDMTHRITRAAFLMHKTYTRISDSYTIVPTGQLAK